MATRGNAAYDLSVYEPKKQQAPQKSPQEQKISVNSNGKNTQRRESAFRMFLRTFAILAVLCAVLYGKVESNMLFREIHQLEQELKDLKAQNITFAAEYEARTSLKNVEEYAENVLGLKKLDKAQIEYVELPGDSVIEIVETENKNIFIIIRNKINELREYLGA